jgi:ParB-like chromosome segregation protein Spo0J
MEPKVKYFRLDEIIGADLNPKDHDIGVIISSIKRFGFTSPLIRNERTKKLIAGHGRLEALIKMFKAGYSLPKNILTDDDMWLVPVITGLDFENEEEAMSYLIADNKLTEVGGWDEETLLAILDTVKDDLEGVGFDESDMQSLYENIESDWEDDDTDRGLGDPRIKYRLIFDNEKQQANWFKFLEWLNNNSDVDGFPARLTEHVKGTFDE